MRRSVRNPYALPARRLSAFGARAGLSTDPYGFALTEVIVAGTLLLLVVQVAWWVTAVQSMVATRVVTGARMLDETRLIHHLLSVEVGHGEGGGDWGVNGRELHLRAFRGVGFACRTQPANGWGVAAAGYRFPSRDKDSVLVLSEDGSWRLSALERRSRTGTLDCQELDGFTTEIWFLDPPRPRAIAALYFEDGAYRFSDGAFRYRIGNSRWQPLTGTGIDVHSSGVLPAGAGGVEARVTWEGRNPIQPSTRWRIWARR